MREADFTIDHSLVAFRYPLEALADSDGVGRSACSHMAVEAHPIDRADRAVLIPGIAGGEVSRLPSEGNLLEVDHAPALNQALPKQVVAAGRIDVLRREHKNRLPNIRSPVKRFDSKSCAKCALSPNLQPD